MKLLYKLPLLFLGAYAAPPLKFLADYEKTNRTVRQQGTHFLASEPIGIHPNGKTLYSKSTNWAISKSKSTWSDGTTQCISDYGDDWWAGFPPSKMYKNYPEYTDEYWTGAFIAFNLPGIPAGGCAAGVCPPTTTLIYKTVDAKKQSNSRMGTCWDLFHYSKVFSQFDHLSVTIKGCYDQENMNHDVYCKYNHNDYYEVPQTGSCGGKQWQSNWWIKAGSYIKEYSGDSKGKTDLWTSYDKGMTGKLKVVCNNFPQYWKDLNNLAVDEDGFVYELQN